VLLAELLSMGVPMRLVLALLVVAAAAAPAAAQTGSKQSEEVLRQRLLLRERFNKGWDVQVENAHSRIDGRCKAEAKKKFSALHPLKRRKYTKDCIRRLRR
jgi:Ni/Co efflux regulator RcnB